MYTVLLGSLPPLTYNTIEEAWDCRYLDHRRGCSCPRGCRCWCFEDFKKLVEKYGSVQIRAVIIYAGEHYEGRRYHTILGKYVCTDKNGRNSVCEG